MTQPSPPQPDHQEPEPAMTRHRPDIIWATGPDILNPDDRDALWGNLTTDQEGTQ